MNETKPILELLKMTDLLVIPESQPIIQETNEPEKPEIPSAPEIPVNNVVVEIEDDVEPAQTSNHVGDINLADYYAKLKNESSVVPAKRTATQFEDSEDEEEFEEV